MIQALLESADGLRAWFVVTDNPPPYYVLPLIEPIRLASPYSIVLPPNLGTRRYQLMEIRKSVNGENYAYYREDLVNG